MSKSVTIAKQKNLTIYTIGHSTHPIEAFINILKSFGITILVDIRTIPRSRHNPQFEKEALSQALGINKISYCYIKNLGGLRATNKNSLNKGWRNLSFRGYADYMQTDEFKHGIEELIALGKKSVICIMCAEAVPWRCHRSLVGDALLVRKVIVENIMSENKSFPHKITKFAQVKGKRILYPPSIEDEI